MNKQSGYINLDFTSMFVGIAVVAAIVGIVVWEFLAWLWPMLKAAIHAATG